MQNHSEFVKNRMDATSDDVVLSWLAAEHARLHVVAERPESPGKQVLVKAICSSIQRLKTMAHVTSFTCLSCRDGCPECAK